MALLCRMLTTVSCSCCPLYARTQNQRSRLEEELTKRGAAIAELTTKGAMFDQVRKRADDLEDENSRLRQRDAVATMTSQVSTCVRVRMSECVRACLRTVFALDQTWVVARSPRWKRRTRW